VTTINYTKLAERNVSFQLLRTNPKLTSNVKLTVDSSGNLWLNSIDANDQLANQKYKRFSVNEASSHEVNLHRFYDSGKTPTTIAYEIGSTIGKTAAAKDLKDQFDFDLYSSGAKYLKSKQYSEKFSYFAPIYLDDVRPQKFVIFKIPGASNYTAGEGKAMYSTSSIRDFSTDLLRKAQLVEVFDLGPTSKIGKYLENISKNPMFTKNPLYVNYKSDGYSIYRGPSIKTGTYLEAPEQLSTIFSRSLPLLKVEQFVTLGFERNSIVHPKIFNLEFLFDDVTSEPYSFNRYIGFYCNDIDLEEFDIDLSAMYSVKAEPSNNPNLISGISSAEILGGQVKSLEVDSINEKIYIVGDFTSYNGNPVNGIARLELNGTYDPTFNTGGGFNSAASVVKLDRFGDILVGGDFTQYNGNQSNYLVKLDQTGSIISTFTGFNDSVSDIAVTIDGHSYVAGKFTTYTENSVFQSSGLVKLNRDMTVDSSFVIGSGFTGSVDLVKKIRLKSDNSLLAIGDFTEYQGVPASSIVQLTQVGSIDLDFDYGSGFNLGSSLEDVTVDQLDNVIIGGEFTSYNSIPVTNLVKLTRSGEFDESFAHSLSTNAKITQVAKDLDSKIYIGGQFSTYNGVPARGLARILMNGELDYTFDTSSGFNNLVVNHILIKNEDVYIAGGFTTYQNKPVSGLINLDNIAIDNDQYLPVEFKQSDDISFTLTNSSGVTLRAMNLTKDLSDIAKNRTDSNNLFFAYLKTKDNDLHLINSEDWYQSGNRAEFKIDNTQFDLGLTFGPAELFIQENAQFSNTDSKSSILIEFTNKPNHLDTLRVYHPSGSKVDLADPFGKFDDIVFTRGYLPESQAYSLTYANGISAAYVNGDLSISQIGQAIIDIVDNFTDTSLSGVNFGEACFIQANAFGDTFGELKARFTPVINNQIHVLLNTESTTSVVYADGGFLNRAHAIIDIGNIEKLSPILNNLVVKTFQNWSSISRLSRVTDLIVNGLSEEDQALALNQFKTKATLHLTDLEEVLVSYDKLEIRKLFKPKVGVLSLFEIMDLDFTTFSTSYSRNLPLDIYRDFYVPAGVKILDFTKNTYKVIGTGTVTINGIDYSPTDLALSGERSLVWQNTEKLSYYEVKSGQAILIIGNKFPNTSLDPNDTTTPNRLDVPYNDESLELVDYIGPFALKASHVSADQSLSSYPYREKFISGNVQSEYHVNLENFTKDFATEGRVIPYISKWGAIDSSDSRDNYYRLNSDITFGKDNFGPSHRETSPTPEKLTHEWFYIESDLGYSADKNLAKYNFNYFDTPLDLSELVSSASYFEEYFTYIPSVDSQQIERPQYRYSVINQNPITKQYETLFKGAMFRFYELSKSASIKRFDDYRFTAILKPIQEDISENRQPVKYRVIENTDSKSITVVIELVIGGKSQLPNSLFSSDFSVSNGNLVSQSNLFSNAFTSSVETYTIDSIVECSSFNEYSNYINGATVIPGELGETIQVKYSNYSTIVATEGSAVYDAVRSSRISNGDKLGERRYAIVTQNTIISLTSGTYQGVRIQSELQDSWIYASTAPTLGSGEISSDTGEFNLATSDILISPISAESGQSIEPIPFLDSGEIDHTSDFNNQLVSSTDPMTLSVTYYSLAVGYTEEILYSITGTSGTISPNDTLTINVAPITGQITTVLTPGETTLIVKTLLDLPTSGSISENTLTFSVEHKTPYFDSIFGDYRIVFNQADVSNLTHSFLYYAKDKKYNNRKTAYSTIKLSRGVDLSSSGISLSGSTPISIKTSLLPGLENYDALADSEINQISTEFAPIYIIKPATKHILVQVNNPNLTAIGLSNQNSTTDGIDGASQDSLLVTARVNSLLRTAVPGEIGLGDSVVYKYSSQAVPSGSTVDWVTNANHFQIFGGDNYFEKIFENLSFAKFTELLEKFQSVISWESYTNGQLSQVKTLSMEIVPADEIVKNTMVQISQEAVQAGQINQIAGYELIEVPSTEYEVNRYSTEYDVIAKPLTAFSYNFSISNINLLGANVKLNPSIDSFFILPEFEYVKYSKQTILDLENSQRYSSEYPLIDETPIARTNYNILSSSWDYGYHFEYLDKTNFNRVPGTRRVVEDYSFVSKLINLPLSFTVEKFTVSELTNSEFLASIAIESNLVFSKFEGEIRFKINLPDLITKQLSTNGLTAEFQKFFKYANGSPIVSDPEFLGELDFDQFVYNYCIQNLIQLYTVDAFEFYELGDRTIPDNSVEFIEVDSNRLTELGYTMIRSIKINNTKSTVVEGSILMKPNTGFKIVPKIKIKFI
jgi:hypothetical protein